MGPYGQHWPSSYDTWILLVVLLFSFLTFLEHDSIANSNLTKGKCNLQLKLFNCFWKSKKKNLTFELLLDLGHMRSGKRTRGERRRKHNCIVLCSGVCRSGEHSAETLHIIIYKCNEAMMKLQRLVQWSSDEKEALHKYMKQRPSCSG